MKRFYLMLIALAALGLVFTGCKKEEEGGGDKPEAAKTEEGKTEEAKKEEPKEEAKEEAKEEGGEEGGADLGIPECDTYINKYMACVEEKVPEAARAQMKDAFEKTKEAWKQAASTDEGKKALAQACTQAMDAAKKAMEQFGCSWE